MAKQQQQPQKPDPDSFSINSAKLCAEAIFNALPKSKQLQYLGALNELFIVLGKVPCDKPDKEYNPPETKK
jgi:hypothetical protein